MSNVDMEQVILQQIGQVVGSAKEKPEGEWFKHGDYIAAVADIKVFKHARSKHQMVVLEFDLLQSNSAELPAGNRGAILYDLNGDYGPRDLKTHAAGILGLRPIDLNDGSVLAGALSLSNPDGLLGRLVHVKVRKKRTRNGGWIDDIMRMSPATSEDTVSQECPPLPPNYGQAANPAQNMGSGAGNPFQQPVHNFAMGGPPQPGMTPMQSNPFAHQQPQYQQPQYQQPQYQQPQYQQPQYQQPQYQQQPQPGYQQQPQPGYQQPQPGYQQPQPGYQQPQPGAQPNPFAQQAQGQPGTQPNPFAQQAQGQPGAQPNPEGNFHPDLTPG